MDDPKKSSQIFPEKRIDFDVSIDEAILAGEKTLHHYNAGLPFPASPEIRRSPAIRIPDTPPREFSVSRSGGLDVLHYDGATDSVLEDEQGLCRTHSVFDCWTCSPHPFSFEEPQQQGGVILFGGTLDTSEAALDTGLDISERLSDQDAKIEVIALLNGEPGPASQRVHDTRASQSHSTESPGLRLLAARDVDSRLVTIPEEPSSSSSRASVDSSTADASSGSDGTAGHRNDGDPLATQIDQMFAAMPEAFSEMETARTENAGSRCPSTAKALSLGEVRP